MKYGHNTRQNRSIVNATDDTSDALRSRQLDCKQWQRYDERPQKHQGEMVHHDDPDHFLRLVMEQLPQMVLKTSKSGDR